MRWAVVAIILTLLGCAGGQTGEITRPSHCTEPTEVTLRDADRARIAPLTEPSSETLTWDEDGSQTELTLAIALVDAPAVRLGGDGCERGILVVPIEVRATTADGRIDDGLAGTLELPDGLDVAPVRASHPIASLEGTLAPGAAESSPNAELIAVFERDAAGSHGQLFVDRGEEEDEHFLGAW